MPEVFIFRPRVELQFQIGRKLLACGAPWIQETVGFAIADRIESIPGKCLDAKTAHIKVVKMVCHCLLEYLKENPHLLLEYGTDFFCEVTFDLIAALTEHDQGIHTAALIVLRHHTNNGWFTEVKNLELFSQLEDFDAGTEEYWEGDMLVEDDSELIAFHSIHKVMGDRVIDRRFMTRGNR